MPITIQGIYEGIPTDPLKAVIYAEGTSTVLNGSGQDVTIDAAGRFAFTPTGSYLITQLYEVALVKRSDGSRVSSRDKVWISSTNGTFTANGGSELAEYFEMRRQFPPQTMPFAVAEVFFFWPYGSGKSLTARRSVNGDALEDIAGSITDIGVEQTTPGKNRYKIVLGTGDKAVGSVAYKISDASVSSQTGTLAIGYLPNPSEITLLPGTLAEQDRDTESTMVVIVGETITTTTSVVDSLNVPVSLAGKTLKLYFDDANQKRVGSPITPTASGSSFTATLPSGMSDLERLFKAALWDETNPIAKAMISQWKVEVRYAPGPLSAT